MRALIAGAGRLGQQVACALAERGNEVVVLDIDDELVAVLEDRLPARVRYGDACEPAVLEEAGVLNADVVVAVTGDDEDNLVTSLLAKRQFDVPRVVARVNYEENSWLFDGRWGVDVAVSAASSLLSLIEEATASVNTVGLLRLATAGVTVLETRISRRSSAAHRPLAAVVLPRGSVVAAVVRAGRPTVPDGSFVVEPGDEVIVVAESATEADIHAAFQR